MPKENREIKSSVFTDIFQECEDAKKYALELYNSINGTNYTDESLINHIKDVDSIYRSVRHDVAFTIEDKVVMLVEHQSTINPNMPLRALMYMGRIYESIIDREFRYSSTLVKIPTPEIYVLYNGKKPYPKHDILRLSDAFKERNAEYNGEAAKDKNYLNQSEQCMDNVSPWLANAIELNVHVININLEQDNVDKDILQKCKTLRDYAIFNQIYQNNLKNNVDRPAREAIYYCIEKDILRDYLLKAGEDVMSFLTAEYDREEDIRVNRKEAYAEGEEKGKEIGREEGEDLINELNSKLIADDRFDDLKKAAVDREYQKKLLQEYSLVDSIDES